jgi:NAD(P)-dependent dehydrogenase (short-subunit alcohol dehydrogenase family)
MNLEGKTAIVTGGSKGYGRGIAEALKNKGCNVWIVSRNADDLGRTADAVGVNFLAADISNPEDWDRIVEKVMEQEGKIDILVNNAGGGIAIKSLMDQTDNEITESINTNLTGHLFGIRRISKLMVEQKSGIIINISSVCAVHAWPAWSVYSAAKAGMEQSALSLHNELREHNVHITTVTPSWGATGFAASAGLPESSEELEKKMMQPAEMGDVIVDICTLPDHLVIPRLRVQPMVQEINPM